MNLAKKMELLHEQIGEGRYTHSLSVADTARQLAVVHGEDPERAYIAGLFHDCAKHLPEDEMLEAAHKAGIVVDDLQRQIPHLLHGLVGAYVAKKDYGVEDEGVLRAIALHNLGALDMTLLDKIVLIADKIEPGRKTEDVNAARELSQADLDATLLHITSHLIMHHLKISKIIYPTTLYLYNDLLLKNRRSQHAIT